MREEPGRETEKMGRPGRGSVGQAPWAAGTPSPALWMSLRKHNSGLSLGIRQPLIPLTQVALLVALHKAGQSCTERGRRGGGDWMAPQEMCDSESEGSKHGLRCKVCM